MQNENNLTIDEIKQLQKQAIDILRRTDPKPILDALGIDYKAVSGGNSYRMNLRNEKHASAFISLLGDRWKFKDFGNGVSGSIENVVMSHEGKDFNDALKFCLDVLNIVAYNISSDWRMIQNYKKAIEDNKKHIESLNTENVEKQKSLPISKVLTSRDIGDYQPAVDFLASRGIFKIPPQLKLINGQYATKNGELKSAYGVGVLTKNEGADIHFLHQVGDLKTMTFGAKDISIFKNENSKKVAIFESKMDYAAAYQQINLANVNIVIANSTSNAHKVAQYLKENEFENFAFFNQNDKQGQIFVETVAKEANIAKYSAIQYNQNEEGKDINDLLLSDQKIVERFVQHQTAHNIELTAVKDLVQMAR